MSPKPPAMKQSAVPEYSTNTTQSQLVQSLYHKAAEHIDQARQAVQQTVDVEMVKAYWRIGRDIVEEQQAGELRASYGKGILKALSQQLQTRYQRGFSVDVLEKARKFYIIYQQDSGKENSSTLSRNLDEPPYFPNLSWSHYVELISIKLPAARQFYAVEASKNRWTVRELRRQIDSFLYDRFARTKLNQEQLLQLAQEGQQIQSPQDAIKDPLILEFLGIEEAHKLSETKLEIALIDNLQHFLLELGKGFAFMGRQQRLSFDNQHFYADLVFYHVILKAYVIVDIKTRPLTHADLGQMLLYVNYYDKEIKQDTDNPTVGLVLCTEKSDKMAKYLLGEKAKQIFASTYKFHLPSIEELEKELKREIMEIKQELEKADDE